MEGPTLFDAPVGKAEPSPTRVRTLAGTLAGYTWPGRASLTKAQQKLAEDVARDALRRMMVEGAE